MSHIEWHNTFDILMPTKGILHVWRLLIDAPHGKFSELWNILSKDEQERARRYVFDKDRTLFVAVRGLLRLLLAHYLGKPADHIEFTYNQYGKPFLKQPVPNILQFNISHSNGIAVIAFAVQTIGIDIEYRNDEFSSLTIAQRFFSAQEVADLQRVPHNQRCRHFFDCWSRKESYIKAKGMGVSLPLESFSTRTLDADRAVLVSSSQFPNDVETLTIIPFQPTDGFSGAITAERPVETIHFMDGNHVLTSRLE